MLQNQPISTQNGSKIDDFRPFLAIFRHFWLFSSKSAEICRNRQRSFASAFGFGQLRPKASLLMPSLGLGFAKSFAFDAQLRPKASLLRPFRPRPSAKSFAFDAFGCFASPKASLLMLRFAAKASLLRPSASSFGLLELARARASLSQALARAKSLENTRFARFSRSGEHNAPLIRSLRSLMSLP